MANSGVGSIVEVRKKFHLTHELILTSYHEAGHAIYGLLKGMKIESVSVWENRKTKRIDGFTHYSSPDITKFNDPELFNYWLYAEICCFYAGLASEKYHFKYTSGSDKLPMFIKDGSSNDILSAAALINQYNLAPPGRKRYFYKKKLISNTSKELQEHWDAVTLIAHALFKKKRLNFNDLKIVLTKKSINRKFWKKQFEMISYIDDNSQTLDEQEFKIILSL
jgi:hypothetical protein